MKIVAGLIFAAGFATSSAPALAQTPPPQPTLIDSAGKVVGPMLDASHVLVQAKPLQALVSVSVARTGFVDLVGTVRPSFYYTTSDCSGQAYLAADEVIPEARIVPAGEFLIPGANVMRVNIKSVSYKGGKQTFCNATDFTGDFAPVRHVSIDALGFTPPFMVKLR